MRSKSPLNISVNRVSAAPAIAFGRCRGPGDPRVNLQSGQGGMAKIYQVKQLLAAVERLGPSVDEG
jgi:hypothetical protein